jgi:glutamine amidotransferase-like uncharacterized protein
MKPRIALFIADPKCSVQSANGIIKALEEYYNFKLFSKNYVEEDFFDNVDMIAIPGGLGSSDSFDTLLEQNKARVLDFINRGGHYLGICMGAYWAGSHYFNMLDGVDAVQYITRPTSDTKRPHAKAIDVIWKGAPEKMFFYDGCAFVGDHSKFTTMSTYANGDPMAIVQERIGLIGCHPESEKFWYDSYSWTALYWHQERHHKLLLEFVDDLLKK